jgi:tetratricopeptide (TPR) repeat protein
MTRGTKIDQRDDSGLRRMGAPASRRHVSRRAGGMPAIPGLRVALSFALFVVVTFSSFAADISAGFDSANKLYEEGKFSDAASAYQKLVQSGTVSPALYFNLGNTYFKSGQLGRAIAAYRDAEEMSPRDPDVRANLQFIRGKVQGPTVSPSAWQRWLAAMTINEWAVLTAAVLWVWLALMAVIQLRPALLQSLCPALWLGGAAILVLAGCLATAWSVHSEKTAIVVAADVVTHNGPLDEAPPSATVHDGAELSVLDAKNGWLQVRVDNQRVGWLKREQVVVAPGV